MPEIDPYRTLGVPRSAPRSEIARAYRRLAKQLHPDVGGAAAADRMRRVNEAWWILSDPGRRATWDMAHPLPDPGSHWQPGRLHPAPDHPAPMRTPAWTSVAGAGEATGPVVRPAPRTASPAPPRTALDTGWAAVGVIAAASIVLAVGMILIGRSVTSQPPPPPVAEFSSRGLSFSYPEGWSFLEGGDDVVGGARLVGQLVNYDLPDELRCTSLRGPCAPGPDGVPSGGVVVLITAWTDGQPRVPNPVTDRPPGVLQGIAGGAPSAYTILRGDGREVTAWWQLSPPGFPDRWFEVHAFVNESEVGGEFFEVDAMLDSIRFTP